MRRRLNALGVSYEITDAVDGKTLDLSQYAHRLRNQCTDIVRRPEGRELSPGEIGIYLSHHNLWKRVAEGENECALILEDDAVFESDFADVVRDVVRCKWHWEIVMLSQNQRRRINRVLCEVGGGRRLLRYKRRVGSAAAYLISREGAAKLRDYCEDIRETIDWMMGEFWKNGLDYYCVEPPPVTPSGEPMTIDGRKRATLTITERIHNKVARRADQLRRWLYLRANPPRKR